MSSDPRIEVVARAIARYRLGYSTLAASLPSDLARGILDNSVEKLWPTFLEEASAIAAALDELQSRSDTAEQAERTEASLPSPSSAPDEHGSTGASANAHAAEQGQRSSVTGFDGL